MTLQLRATETAERPRTLVWLDSRTAVLARWDGTDISLRHIRSDVPVHRRSTGHVTGAASSAAHAGGLAPRDDGEARRLEHLARFLRGVADAVEPFDALVVTGLGTVPDRLATLLRDADAAGHRTREIIVTPAGHLTDRQLLARLRLLAGVTLPRRRGTRGSRVPRRRRPGLPPLPEEETG